MGVLGVGEEGTVTAGERLRKTANGGDAWPASHIAGLLLVDAEGLEARPGESAW